VFCEGVLEEIQVENCILRVRKDRFQGFSLTIHASDLREKLEEL
jgi:hypothetical protein